MVLDFVLYSVLKSVLNSVLNSVLDLVSNAVLSGSSADLDNRSSTNVQRGGARCRRQGDL